VNGSLVVYRRTDRHSEAIMGAFLYMSLFNAPKFVYSLTNNSISIAKTCQLILIKGTTAVYSENRTQPTTTHTGCKT
jgi:hypothetical protein